MTESRSFRALWALMVGLFLIVVDSTVVAVANPVLKDDFGVDYGSVLWVTSGYLLAFAALLLVGGRLGDRFGPKGVYLVGLAIFSASSVWCGLSSSIGMLTVARVLQGAGAALLAPQIFTTITRMFPSERRGMAMSVWGATTGVGLFAGPILGGVLLDQLGWQWIFFVNAPIGALGLALAVWLVPALPGRGLHMDVLGVLLWGAGISLIVFGLQEGQRDSWSVWIVGAILGGLALLVAFAGWQAVYPNEPLIPLRLILHRNFILSNAGIALVSFAFVAFVVPLMIFLEDAYGLSPVRAALLTAPMAVATVVLAPVVGKIVDRVHPRPIVIFGFALLAIALLWLALEMTRTTSVWQLVLPLTAVGAASAFTWEPLAVIASRALPTELAGAGSALCNTARHLGAAVSSASVAALTAALLIGRDSQVSLAGAMSQSMLLPAVAAALGAVTALFFVERHCVAAAAAPVRGDVSVPL
ncbi:DHA2 family efflux MFS transporter permease subunit [Mycobacterium sp. EPa45]|uniref:DHA2 family efflux MFS transporter permease subunit n=1 Tax=Mycobacterium sp. EPa45 TaxID=1545728 RepID=UPI000B2C18CF|nr:DHA2 family efflux MFS transporter permease subunit [Mycobacterium sp. EPa45]